VSAFVDSTPRVLTPGSASAAEPGPIWNLRAAEQLIDAFVEDLDPGRHARSRAYWRALALLGDEAAGEDTPRAALIGFARDVLAELAVELTADVPALRSLICRLESSAGIPALELGRELVRAPQLLRLAAAVAIEVELTLLLAFTPAISVTLWTLSATGEPQQLACAGSTEASDHRVRRLALRLLAGQPMGEPPDSDIAGIPVDGAHGRAVLVSRGSGAAAVRHLLLLEAGIPILAAALARAQPSPDSAQTLGHPVVASADMGAAERRLARVRYDLHDGPQQDLMLLAEDLRVFRTRLDSVLASDETRTRVAGCFDDFEARLTALEGDLRRISVAAESPLLNGESLPEALAHLTDAFAQRTNVKPQVRLRGHFTDLTDSQQITLLGLVREALNNIRKHAGAEHVTISLSSNARGVEAAVIDDGGGFEPETMRVAAAQHGHLGLVGMHERVRMLGGETHIESRPGGPTVISVSLPPAPVGAVRRVRQR